MGMLDRLRDAEEALPELLQNEKQWRDVDVNYHPPRVERLWMPFQDGRLFLHRIHPCEPAEALLHPHTWPSAMSLVEGEYIMGTGTSVDNTHPSEITQHTMMAGSRYAMESPEEWHYVAPVREAVLSIMVIGKKWKRLQESHEPHTFKALEHLAAEQRQAMFAYFRRYFPKS